MGTCKSYKIENGGEIPGTLTVDRDRFRGEEYVTLGLDPAVCQVNLTAGQARAVADDLTTEAAALDVPLPVGTTGKSEREVMKADKKRLRDEVAELAEAVRALRDELSVTRAAHGCHCAHTTWVYPNVIYLPYQVRSGTVTSGGYTITNGQGAGTG